MGKTKRNDPCHCGSGKKYKKCCIERDKIAKQKEKEREWEEQIRREKEERASLVSKDKEMVAQMMESQEPKASLITPKINDIYLFSSEKGEYESIYQWLQTLQSMHPRVYNEVFHSLWMPLMGSSFALQEWGLVLQTIPYLDPNNAVEFYSKRDCMMYLGEPSLLHKLCDLMKKNTPKKKASYTPSSHSPIDFHSSSIQLMALCAFERDPSISAEDLYGELQLHLSSSLNKDWVFDTILSPFRRGLPLVEEILKDPNRESMLYPLGWSLASALTKELEIPLSRALLGVQFLQLFLEEQCPETGRGPLRSSIVPGDYFIYLTVLTETVWHFVALFEIAPYYIDLLERAGLLRKRKADTIYSQIQNQVKMVLAHCEIEESIRPFFPMIAEMIKEKYHVELVSLD